jgi:hypothetical protein
MGIGWVFGLLTIENRIVAFQYLFGVFVGLQGFFIFYLFDETSVVFRNDLVFSHIWRESLVWAAYQRGYGSGSLPTRFILSSPSLPSHFKLEWHQVA